MKKLIVSAVALTAAIMVRGASVDWSFDGTYDTPETYNYSLYWLNSADGASTYASALAGGTYSSASDFTAAIASDLAQVYGGQPVSTGTGGFASGLFTDVNGTEVYSALILQSTAEGANIFYYDDLALAGLTYSAGQPAPGSLDIYNDDAGYTSGGVIKYTAGGGGGDVPEPTSGLLLALGGAMLALRRRRA